ncbi:class I SAM-dependent methyltransferase [Nocardia suismassiliense]|uniref:Class I SAM-dependent methyltransferase n=1 Tax=Nocardia suismassiliense TaxID=2077092 RepID=A0ABW6QV99_9NOCA
MGTHSTDTDAARFWDEHYRTPRPIRTGRANPVLTEIADALTPGTVLDLGCGPGDDALWLAARGWQVTAVDIAATAVRRLAEKARALDLHYAASAGDRPRWPDRDRRRPRPDHPPHYALTPNDFHPERRDRPCPQHDAAATRARRRPAPAKRRCCSAFSTTCATRYSPRPTACRNRRSAPPVSTPGRICSA